MVVSVKGVDGQRKCPAKWPAKMSLVLLAMITDSSYPTRSRLMAGPPVRSAAVGARSTPPVGTVGWLSGPESLTPSLGRGGLGGDGGGLLVQDTGR